MMTAIDSHQPARRTRALRTVAVVGGHACSNEIQTVLGAVDHDVVFIQSIAHAYAQIKRATPDLVIVCLGGDDVDGCRLLSMLTLDRDTARIPVLTYITAASFTDDGGVADAAEDMLTRFIPGSLN
jgi:CheY-like chemotaxis protein